MLDIIKQAVKSKLVMFGSVTAVLGLLEAFDITKFAQYIPDQYEPLIVSFIGFVVVVLRYFTTLPVSKK
jgi:hypothetical protein